MKSRIASSQLSRFLPAVTLRRATELAAFDRSRPHCSLFSAAILFVDISGFTALTERLAHQGRDGIDTLDALLNQYFGEVLNVVEGFGGDVINFAGDSFFAMWGVADGDLRETTLRAAHCGLVIRDEYDEFSLDVNTKFCIRLALGAGKVSYMEIGGVSGHWQNLVAGEPYDQIRSIQDVPRLGELVISAEVFEVIKSVAEARHVTGGAVILERLREYPTPQCLKIPSIDDRALAVIQSYIPPFILSYLDGPGERWMADYRNVTVLFLRIENLHQEMPRSLDSLQWLCTTVQVVLERFEGALTRVASEDKGTILMAVFGLPYMSHEDDALRCMRASFAIQRKVQDHGLSVSIGAALGKVVCGAVGGARRCEYTIHGDAVNIAARLLALAHDDILCDTGVRDSTKGSDIAYIPLPVAEMKGFKEPVALFRPIAASRLTDPGWPLVDQLTLLSKFNVQLEQLKMGHGSVIVLEGEAGVGKTRLLREFVAIAARQEVPVIAGAGDAMARDTPYGPWRTILCKLLGVREEADPRDIRERLLQTIGEDGSLPPLAPLLNQILPLELSSSQLIRTMAPEVRRENVRGLIQAVIKARFSCSPFGIALEDAHWIDPTSLHLVKQIAARTPNMLLLLTTRPKSSSADLAFKQLVDAPETQRFPLDVLSKDDTYKLLGTSLGVPRLAPKLVAEIFERANGNPQFTEELAHALRESGMVILRNGSCHLREDEKVGTRFVPDKIEKVIQSRTDQLSPSQQILLKTASVIGPTFSRNVLERVLPSESPRERFDSDLKALRETGLIRSNIDAAEGSYEFKHKLTQEVTYNSLLRPQRIPIHRAILKYYESIGTEDQRRQYALLSYHALCADEYVKAGIWFEKAAIEALSSGSNAEAIRFIDSLETLPIKESNWHAPVRRSERSRIRGEALYNVGQLKEARQAFETALRELTFPPPRKSFRGIVGMATGFAIQVCHRILGARPIENEDQAKVLTLAARIYERLVEIHYLGSRLFASAYSLLIALNMSERLPNSPERARSFAAMCVLVGYMPPRAIARGYASLALSASQSLGNEQVSSEVSMMTALHYASQGIWMSAVPLIDFAIQGFQAINDRRQLGYCLSLLAEMNTDTARYAESDAAARSLITLGRESQNPLQEAWGIALRIESAIRIGSLSNVRVFLDQLKAAPGGEDFKTQPVFAASMNAFVAFVQMADGDLRAAAKSVQEGVHKLDGTVPLNYTDYTVRSLLAEISVCLLQDACEHERMTRSIQSGFRVSMAGLRTYALMHPIGRPMWHLLRGRYRMICGARRRAIRAFTLCIREAKKRDMPHEEAVAYVELAQASNADRETKASYLKEARSILNRIGVAQQGDRIIF